MDVTATVWTLLPPIIAIALALITKEVYSSLMIGILSGALLYTGFHPLKAVETTFTIMGSKLGDNINICIFLVLLGILVSLITKSGASRAYGEWAVKTIRSRRGASFATSFLGMFIFVDDYFNCLTVGTVMRPVTDKYSISRAKLAYIIDATAAPVCIIAPISSWAAAVGSSLPESSTLDCFSLFLKTIPLNLYALLTLAFLIWLMAADFDFGPMKKYELAHKDDDLSLIEETHVVAGSGKVYDLILPISVLIVLCIAGMLYTGGILEGANIVEAFANCDSSTALVLGSFFTLLFTFVLYIPRKVLSFGQFCEAFTEGFKAMVPAILILTLAWTLSGVLAFVLLLRRVRSFDTGHHFVLFAPEMLRRLTNYAVPSIAQQSFVSVGNVVIQYYINLCGATVIAGFSAANRVNQFALTCCMSFASGLSSYVAQNIGARKLDRIGPGLKWGAVYSLGLSVVFMAIYLPFANKIISLFVPAGSASGVIDVARGYLFTVVPFYLVVCTKFVCDSVLRGAGAMRPFMVTTFSDLIIRVVLSIALFYVVGNEHGIWLSWPIGWFLGSGLSVFFYKSGAWKKNLPTF